MIKDFLRDGNSNQMQNFQKQINLQKAEDMIN